MEDILMPSRSEKQRKMIFAKRNKYKTKKNTPEKDKWIWKKEYENKGELSETTSEGLKISLQLYINRLYTEGHKLLSMQQFDFYSDVVGTGRRGTNKKYFVTYDDLYGDVFDGEIIIGDVSGGRDFAFSNVSEIVWDDEVPENWEEIEDYIRDHWDVITKQLERENNHE